jgi:hypothetical protein
MATIDDLVRLVPRPDSPIDATGDWERVETDLGLELPPDFKMLVHRYGRGQFRSFITPLNPFGPPAVLIAQARRLQGGRSALPRGASRHRPLRFLP